MKQKNSPYAWMRLASLRVIRVHFLFIIAYALQIIVFDSWNLISHEAVMQRWTGIVSLLVLDTVLWFITKNSQDKPFIYTSSVISLIIADIILASFTVFWERGMASPSVILYALAIISAAIMYSRSMLLATAGLCSAGYSIAVVRYFNLYYGEGFRVQLWGEVGFYCAIFFILALMLMAIIGLTNNST